MSEATGEEGLGTPTARAGELLRSGLRPEDVQDRLVAEGIEPLTASEVVRQMVPPYLRGEVRRLLGEGHATIRIQDALIERGFDKAEVFTVVDEVLAGPPPQRPGVVIGGSGPPSGPGQPHQGDGSEVMQVVGGLVMLVGVGFFLGNITGVFPTVPGLGWGTIIVGSLIYGAGQKKS
jgi:hypothetical protein